MNKLEAEQPLVYQTINNMIDRRQLPHALIFYGDKSTSKKEMAMYLTKYQYAKLFNEDIETSHHSRRIDDHSFTNLIIIEPTKGTIKKDQILSIIDEANKSSLEEGPKVFIFNEADTLNQSSANSLLKFIEEPLDDIYIIFLVNNLNSMLPTIKSRCTVFSFNYEFTNLLSLLNITEEVFEKYYLDAMQIVYNLENLPKYQLLKYLKDISKKERNDILEIFKLVLKIYTIKFENRLHSCYNELEFTEQIINLIQDDDEYNLVKKINNINMIINLISNNTNRDLTLTRLAVIWE